MCAGISGIMVFLQQQRSAHNGHLLALIARRHAMLAPNSVTGSQALTLMTRGGRAERNPA
jgi:hypothetical protein